MNLVVDWALNINWLTSMKSVQFEIRNKLKL